jgi:hypothetical protein
MYGQLDIELHSSFDPIKKLAKENQLLMFNSALLPS